MGYVSRVLQPGEAVIHEARLHNVIFLPAISLLVVAIAVLIASLDTQGELRLALEGLAALLGLLAVLSWARTAIRRATTEFAVTDRRIIYKVGLFARHTLEMNRGKVESVDVDQSILGRLCGFGTVIVRGTGGSLEPILYISDPLAFRSHITAV